RLLPPPGWRIGSVTQDLVSRRIERWRLPGWMQCLEECDQRGRFRRTQILAVCRHVAAALNDLSNELILRQPHGHAVERRPPFPTALPEGVTVAALLGLKDERALSLEGGRAHEQALRNRVAAPGVHMRTPRSDFRETRERSQRYCGQKHGQHRYRPPPPALLSFSRQKRQEQQDENDDDGADQQCGRLERGGKQ